LSLGRTCGGVTGTLHTLAARPGYSYILLVAKK
jgi:hypothetical protein